MTLAEYRLKVAAELDAEEAGEDSRLRRNPGRAGARSLRQVAAKAAASKA